MTTDRKELLQFEGISRSVLEDRIITLVRVLDAANELVASNDAASSTDDVMTGERFDQAWNQLRSVLKAV